MTKKKVFSGFSDGLIQGLILCLLLMFTVSPFGDAVSIEGLLVISGALALLSPLSYYIMVVKSSRGKGLLALSAMSFLGFVLMVLLFVLVPWGQMLFPDRLICFSMEIIWQYEMLVFLCVSVILRLLLIFRQKKKT